MRSHRIEVSLHAWGPYKKRRDTDTPGMRCEEGTRGQGNAPHEPRDACSSQEMKDPPPERPPGGGHPSHTWASDFQPPEPAES